MRVRILKTPPVAYAADTQSLLVGRIYNLDASLASALLIEGCAELYDGLSDEEKRQRSRPDLLWHAADSRKWFMPRPSGKDD